MTPLLDPAEIAVDFDESCALDGLVGFVLNRKGEHDLKILRRLYQRNFPAPLAERPKIPTVLHQIWLGGKEMPALYRRYHDNWRKLHPAWEYRLWDDDAVANVEWDNRDLLATADGIGEKTDVLRAEILLRHGGLYVDTDYDFYKPLDTFHHICDFYTTLRPTPTTFILSGCPENVYPLGICNSLIGATPDHPILHAYLQIVRGHWQQKRLYSLRLGERFSPGRWLLGLDRFRRMCQTLARTYFPFEQAFLQTAGSGDFCDIAFPPTFFNPVDVYRKYRFYSPRYYWCHLRYRMTGGDAQVPPFQHITRHSFTHHDSKMAWL